jgi:hypothetical protein
MLRSVCFLKLFEAQSHGLMPDCLAKRYSVAGIRAAANLYGKLGKSREKSCSEIPMVVLQIRYRNVC